jgi:WD40 repeat protein
MDTKRNIVISGSYDTTLKMWELNSGACLNTLRGHSGAVLAVQVGLPLCTLDELTWFY